MSNAKRKLQLLTMFGVMLLLATAVSCKGFFVNSPSSVTVSPSPVSFTALGQPQQLTATASFDSGPNQNVSSSSTWSTSNVCEVTVTTSGQVTAVGDGPAVTITATFNGVQGNVSANVPTGISISPCGAFNVGQTNVSFTANLSGTDVTSSTTWGTSDSSKVSFPNANAGTAVFGPNKGTVNVTASNGSNTGELLITVQ